jgi:hypothetical protein
MYGVDYAYHKITGTYQENITYPVFGVVEDTEYYDITIYDEAAGEEKIVRIDGAIYKTIMSEVDQLEIIIEESDAALLEKVETNLKEIRTIIENNYNDLAAQIKELRNELENAIKGVEANVEKLLARVQSLVYVPDFDDHKAAIYFAELNKTKTYISRQSIMRYRVNAKAGESAEKAAAELAEAWKADPTILSFELEQVATRSEEAALKIAKVEAKGEDLFVYAVAKNFASDFFAKDKKMYSAALVLSDGNNNISSSYTNLRAGNKDNVTAVVITIRKRLLH